MSGMKKYYEFFEKELHTEKAITEKASLEASRHHEKGSKTDIRGSPSSNSSNRNSSRKTVQNSDHVSTQHPRTIKITRNPIKSTQKTRQNGLNNTKGKGVIEQEQLNHRRTLSFNETSVLIAFILVILTLLIITLAMFKLAGSIAALSERLYTMEDLLAQYSKECQFVNNVRAVPA